MKQLLKSKQLRVTSLILATALLLYVLGVKFIFVPALLFCITAYVPAPKVFGSWLSRLVFGAMVMYSLLLVSFTFQFLFFRGTGFGSAATLTAVLTLMVVALTLPHQSSLKAKIVDTKDGAAMIVVALFTFPLIWLSGFWQNDPSQLVRFAGLQSPDATSHFGAVGEAGQSQGFNYFDTPSYYPRGFHLTTGFIQDSAGLMPLQLDWQRNAKMFVGHYLFFGAIWAYLLFYLCRQIFDKVGHSTRAPNWLLALSFGLPVSALYLLPFVFEGFLNYYHVGAALTLGLVLLLGVDSVGNEQPGLKKWFIAAYLLITFIIGMSWPLLTPVMLATLGLYLLPATLKLGNIKSRLASVLRPANLLLISLVLLQAIPFYLQFRFSTKSTIPALNEQGSIVDFHYGLVIAGLIITAYLLLSPTTSRELRKFVWSAFTPLYGFLGALMTLQYLVVGNIRYYSIKTAFLVEITVLALAVALLVWHTYKSANWQKALVIAGLPLALCILLIGMTGANPLKQVKEMVLVYKNGDSSIYGHNVTGMVKLLHEGKLQDMNIAVMHYQPESKVYYGNLLLPNWVNTLSVSSSNPDVPAHLCNGQLFPIAMYEPVSPAQQANLINKVKECIALAARSNRDYYIITDKDSEPALRSVFGDTAKLVY